MASRALTRKVHHHLLQLYGIEFHLAEVTCRAHREDDVFSNQARQELHDAIEHHVDVQHLQRLHLLAPESQQLPGKICGAAPIQGRRGSAIVRSVSILLLNVISKSRSCGRITSATERANAVRNLGHVFRVESLRSSTIPSRRGRSPAERNLNCGRAARFPEP
jgi:hypothetical protein